VHLNWPSTQRLQVIEKEKDLEIIISSGFKSRHWTLNIFYLCYVLFMLLPTGNIGKII